jgi:DNA polymerase-3 subunit alpha
VLSSDMDNTEKVVMFLDECRALKVDVLPPHINASHFMFEAKDAKTIRYGLGAIKGVGENASLEIARIRDEDGPYRDQFDFAKRLGQKVNRRVHEVLIKAGALDGLGPNRASMFEHLAEVLRATEQLARDAAAGQFDIFGAVVSQEAPPLPPPPPIPEWDLLERLSYERETLGHYLSGHPIDPLREVLDQVIACTLDKVGDAWEQRRYVKGNDALVLIAGQVSACRKMEERAFLTLEDGRGALEVSLFNDVFREHAALLRSGAFLIFEGQLQEDRFRGGIAMRVKRVWEVDAYCAQYANPVRIVFDTTLENASVAALDAALSQFRPGPTAVKIALHTATARGEIELHERQYVRAVPALLQALRAVPGVTEAKFAIPRAPLPTGRNDRDRDPAMFEVA